MSHSFAQVIVPVPLNATFTYAIPAEMADKVFIGSRVIVPFGRKKYYTGIVSGFALKAPEGFEVRDISLVLDDHPILRNPQLKLWDWIADYYLCAPGDVLKAALPAGLRVESETFVETNPDFEFGDDVMLSERETIIWQLLDHEGALTVSSIAPKAPTKNLHATIAHMLQEGYIIVSEKLVERYRAKREPYVKPLFPVDSTEAMDEAFSQVKGAPKQETLLLALIELSRLDLKNGGEGEVSRQQLLERSGVTPAVLQAVVKKNIITAYKKEINRFAFDGSKPIELPTLTPIQSRALGDIHSSWLETDITLLHGVTSSGKTEIYQHLIDDVMKRGRQVLYLVPEIALTTQLTKRLQSVFGKRVIIYHSKFSDNERADIWKHMLADSSPCVVIGARSSVFLPFSSLGLVIVDEEHEQSYKQFDPAPRYNARDCAIVLAKMHGAKTLLGSATPSIETYYKALNHKFGLVSLTTRYSDAPLPEIQVIDMQRERKAKHISGIFSLDTIAVTADALGKGKQAIMFQPRRGYAPLARCRQCAWTPRCSRCDVAYTFHRDINRLVCHYCGSSIELPRVCPQCKEPAIETLGYGTERVEDEVATAFPGHSILRMDLDTTRNKNSYEQIITDFSTGHGDILVGTQMVTKGLDFGNVSVVAVLNADSLINFPDFRATERAFNTLSQVAGRAGRRGDIPGKVVIQTSQPQNPIFSDVINHDYTSFYDREIAQRQQYNYPPFTRIIYIYLKHRDKLTINSVSLAYAERLKSVFGNRVYGPEKPPVERINALYIRKLMLKVEHDASMKQVKQLLKDIYDRLFQDPTLKGVSIYYDVDPM